MAFFSLFFTLDLAFLFLAIQHQVTDATLAGHMGVAGGSFGIMAAFLAWYNMFAGIADSSNFFFGMSPLRDRVTVHMLTMSSSDSNDSIPMERHCSCSSRADEPRAHCVDWQRLAVAEERLGFRFYREDDCVERVEYIDPFQLTEA